MHWHQVSYLSDLGTKFRRRIFFLNVTFMFTFIHVYCKDFYAEPNLWICLDLIIFSYLIHQCFISCWLLALFHFVSTIWLTLFGDFKYKNYRIKWIFCQNQLWIFVCVNFHMTFHINNLVQFVKCLTSYIELICSGTYT